MVSVRSLAGHALDRLALGRGVPSSAAAWRTVLAEPAGAAADRPGGRSGSPGCRARRNRAARRVHRCSGSQKDSREANACRTLTVLCLAPWKTVAYQVRRSDRARRVRVTVDATRGVEVVLPRRAPEREAAAAIRELRAVDRAPGRASSRARGRLSRRAATPSRTSAGRWRSSSEPGRTAGARAVAMCCSCRRCRADAGARALVPPRGAGRDRAAPGPRLRAGRHVRTRGSRSAGSGRAGRAARAPGR